MSVMTDALKLTQGRRFFGRTAMMAAVAALALSAGGCGTSGNILDSLGPTPPAPAAAITPARPTKKNVAFAPLIGAPANVSQQLTASMTSAVEKQNVPVIKGGAKSDYTVRGYVVAAPDQAGTKLSYIWDVTDPSGKRAHRITGEEFVKGRAGSDPWANVSPTVLNGIAQKSATQLAAWVPPVSPAGGTAAGVGGPTPTGAATSPVPLAAKASTPANVRTASLAKGPLPVLAMVPPVAGAPGDGQRALADALKRNLASRGVKLTTKPSLQTYTVKGNVAMGRPAAGKQDIEIKWLVLDPKGQKVGTVAQKNKIPQGSLNGKWGKTADAAATAAATGVAKLLPKTIKVN